MEDDREVDKILMNVRGTTGGIITASILSARITFKVLVFLLRMAKKGLVATGFADGFKEFTKQTEGNFSVYNIPLTADKAEKMVQLNELEIVLENEKNPLKKRSLQMEIKNLQKELPELEQLNKLGINCCVLPKLNGSTQTIQIAVAKESDQMFKNWFLNHLTSSLTGGERQLEDIKVFTEGNYSIFNLPFEGEEFEAACKDFDILGMNYSVLPDLKIGDNNSQIVVPNADRSKLEMWFKMWKEKKVGEGSEPGEMYSMEQESYLNTATMSQYDYATQTDEKYRAANEEFEKQEKELPWTASLAKENSEEFVRYESNPEYEKITINKETLVDNMAQSQKEAQQMLNEGYFISRVPGTYGENQETLILPAESVFKTDEEKTFVAFIPKNKTTKVVAANGKVEERSFASVYKPYDQVKRGFKMVEDIQKKAPMQKAAIPTPKVSQKIVP